MEREEQEKAFVALKQAVANATMFINPNSQKPVILERHTSNQAMCDVLMQHRKGKGKPVAFASKTLSEVEI